jgi:hypothetical protein
MYFKIGVELVGKIDKKDQRNCVRKRERERESERERE